ncbi:late embryogenesis abundant protein [Leptospira ryugenii]|uniref:Late embryogenesis abundant protein n=1 Tax=Leptospira ryugenii TaxID=1917863 RepID=A0A2P2DX53_9LEPT|nr:late embryogenesis abundant protein [Leptospira ryugenii]
MVQCSILGVLKDKVPKPEFSFESISIKEVTLTDLTLKMNTQFENPYPVSLPKSLLNMDLKIEGTKLSHISTDLGEIQAKQTRQLPFEIKIKYSDLLKIYQTIPDKQVLAVSLIGDLKVPLPQSIAALGKESVSFPFQQERVIPAVLPNVDIQNFAIEMPSRESIVSQTNTSALAETTISFLDGLLSGKSKTQSAKSAASAGLSNLNLKLNTNFDLNFQNKAASELLFQDFAYQLKLAGEPFLDGKPKEIVNNGRQSTVKINTAFPIAQISQGLYKTIQSKTASFDLNGKSGMKVPGIEDTMDFNYSKLGKFNW